jgi:hypothetical protein
VKQAYTKSRRSHLQMQRNRTPYQHLQVLLRTCFARILLFPCHTAIFLFCCIYAMLMTNHHIDINLGIANNILFHVLLAEVDVIFYFNKTTVHGLYFWRQSRNFRAGHKSVPFTHNTTWLHWSIEQKQKFWIRTVILQIWCIMCTTSEDLIRLKNSTLRKRQPDVCRT